MGFLLRFFALSFKIRERHFLRNKFIKALREKIKEQFLVDPYTLIPKQSEVELIKSDEFSLYIVNKHALLIEFKDILLPSLHSLLENKLNLPTITVDKGAVPYVTKGAHIMAPGIMKVDPIIKEGTFVAIIDETHHKPLAIGKAVLDADEIQKSGKGKAVHNLHYIGDKIWSFVKQLE